MGISALHGVIPAANPPVPVGAYSSDLANRILAGDRGAEAEFAEVFSRRLMLILLRNTQDLDIARDCCQKTLLIALTKMRAGEILRPASLMAFLKCTASNVVIAYFRTEKRYTSLGDRVFQLRAPQPHEAAGDRDRENLRELLMRTLGRLSVPRDREILCRFYLEEEGKLDICRDFGIKPEHFDRVLYRAKQRIRLVLGAHGDARAMLERHLREAGEADLND